jgi:OLD-like protein
MEDDQRSRQGATGWAAGGRRAPLIAAAVNALVASAGLRAVVLVEGTSDQRALEALAARRGRDLDAEGVSIVSLGGATTIGRFLDSFAAQGLDVTLAGLCDAAEEGYFRRGLARAGFGTDLTRAEMEALGFYVCVADLEDELIRSLGAARVEQVIDAHGELGPFRTFQKQPAQRRRTTQEQLRRFLGTRSGRKSEYAASLVNALDLDQVPRPLDGVLAYVQCSRIPGRARPRIE